MCSNKVVGWAVDDHMRTGLVLEAVDNALAARGPGIGIDELGCTMTAGPSIPREGTATAFSPRVLSRRSGTPAYATTPAAESFNATIKKELIISTCGRRGEVKTAVFDYIERYYNHVRKQRGSAR